MKFLISLFDGSPLRPLFLALVDLGALNEVTGWGSFISLGKCLLNTYMPQACSGCAKETGPCFWGHIQVVLELLWVSLQLKKKKVKYLR